MEKKTSAEKAVREIRRKTRRAAFIEGYENNPRVFFAVVVDVLKSRTEKQSGRLQREIDNIREDLLQLLADVPAKTPGMGEFGQFEQARLTGQHLLELQHPVR